MGGQCGLFTPVRFASRSTSACRNGSITGIGGNGPGDSHVVKFTKDGKFTSATATTR
jgi:hypothetical protein